MTHDFKPGDIIRLNGTQQQAEVLELSEDYYRGELLRVKLLNPGLTFEGILFVLPQLVELVRTAESENPRPGKKILT